MNENQNPENNASSENASGGRNYQQPSNSRQNWQNSENQQPYPRQGYSGQPYANSSYGNSSYGTAPNSGQPYTNQPNYQPNGGQPYTNQPNYQPNGGQPYMNQPNGGQWYGGQSHGGYYNGSYQPDNRGSYWYQNPNQNPNQNRIPNPNIYGHNSYDQPGQDKHRKNKGAFWGGLGIGLGVGLCLLMVVFLRFPGLGTVMKSGGLTMSEASELVSKSDTLIRSIDQNYYGDSDHETMLDGAYHGIVASLGDPYSEYLNEEEYSSFTENSNGTYVGIGVTVELAEGGGARIVAVNDDSGASEAGLQVGDVIVAADGEDMTTKSLSEIVTYIRGEENTTVSITYTRDGSSSTVDVERRRVQTNYVTYGMVEGTTVGYIRLSGFEGTTYAQFVSALSDLQTQGMTSLVLDLRDNPGGRVDVVLQIADIFLEDDLVTYFVDKNGNQEDYYATKDGNEFSLPMVVLVNENTASAAELLAGNLQYYGCGTIVGTQTYGKGIVQVTSPLYDGSALKLTTEWYYLPSGVCIQGIGITPDVEAELPEGETTASLRDGNDLPSQSNDPQFAKALELLLEQEQ